MGGSLGIRLVNIVVLLTVCGCVPPLKRATPTATRHVHREHTIRSNRAADHELSDAEKDKLFRGFERWLAAKRQVELRAAQQNQSAREVGDAEKPDEWR